MNNFPLTDKIALGSTRTTINPALRSSTDGGYMYTKKKYTKEKQKYTLSYPILTYAEADTLKDFFNENQGKKFKFTYPAENKEVVCVFAMDELALNDDFSGHCSTKIELVEA